MDLQPQEHSFCGYFSFPRIQDVACPEFRSLHFVHSQDPEESYYDLRLNDRLTSWYGFSHCGTFLHGITGNIVTFPRKEVLSLLWSTPTVIPDPALQLGLDATLVEYGHTFFIMKALQIKRPGHHG